MEFSKRIWGTRRPQLVNELHTLLTQATIRGRNPKQLVKDVTERFDLAQKKARNKSADKARGVKNRVDNDSESGIIVNEKSSLVNEEQRYGRNKNTLINKTYIDGGEYRRKFDTISENTDLNKALYQCSKKALKHRSGTQFEDMYWIDGETGRILASATNEESEKGIGQLKKRDKMLKEHANVYAIHTHPASMSPSPTDFNTYFEQGYSYAIVACHDGKIYRYAARERIDDIIYEAHYKKFIKNGYGDFDAQIATIEELKKEYDIDFSEVM